MEDTKRKKTYGNYRSNSHKKNRRKRHRRRRIRPGCVILPVIVLVLIFVLVLALTGNEESQTGKSGTAEETRAVGENILSQIAGIFESPSKAITPVRFNAVQAELLDIYQTCRCAMDPEALLLEPLEWDMMASDFQVLILHSHVSESYTKAPGDDYVESEPYRTADPDYNMAVIGERVAQVLREYGITVIHDTTSYEIPTSEQAYTNAKKALEQTLQENPSIRLVIDIHRDAALDSDGNQWSSTITVDGKETSQLSFVVGTGCRQGGNANFLRNMAYAEKLEVQLDTMYPGICRRTLVNTSMYNQNLDATFLLAEVGLAGDTLEEALNGAQCLAEGILALAKGTVSE